MSFETAYSKEWFDKNVIHMALWLGSNTSFSGKPITLNSTKAVFQTEEDKNIFESCCPYPLDG